MAEFFTSEMLSTIPQIKHGFFCRDGGVSKGIYSSLNCGVHSHDNSKNVLKNRNIAVSSLSDKAVLAEIHQIHSNKVHIIQDEFTVIDADGVVTDRDDIALSIVTADCAPVLFVDDNAHVIAASHAGWQGAYSGIIENTINTMCSIGADKKNITAAIGPCIAQKSYEVGPEFFNKIADEKFFKLSEKKGHFLFDLEGYVYSKLKACNILRIDKLSIDTYEQENNCFSYRRKTHMREDDYGRQVSIILQNKL